MIFSLTVNDTSILPVPGATFLGVFLGPHLCIIPHVKSTSKACSFTFHYICTIHLPSSNLVQTIFVSHLDPCNNLLKINPAVTLKCILYIANSSWLYIINHISLTPMVLHSKISQWFPSKLGKIKGVIMSYKASPSLCCHLSDLMT